MRDDVGILNHRKDLPKSCSDLTFPSKTSVAAGVLALTEEIGAYTVSHHFRKRTLLTFRRFHSISRCESGNELLFSGVQESHR